MLVFTKRQDLDVNDVALEELEVLQVDEVTAPTLVLNRPAYNSSDEAEMADLDDEDLDCLAFVESLIGAGRRCW